MKKSIFLLLMVVAVASMSFIGYNQPKNEKLSVKFTVEEWQSKLNAIEYSKEVIKNSDAPTKVAIPLIDSLSKIQIDIVNQLKPQLVDTTNNTPVTPKKK